MNAECIDSILAELRRQVAVVQANGAPEAGLVGLATAAATVEAVAREHGWHPADMRAALSAAYDAAYNRVSQQYARSGDAQARGDAQWAGHQAGLRAAAGVKAESEAQGR